MYKKEAEAAMPPAAYTEALSRLDFLRADLRELGAASSSSAIGSRAAAVRVEVRQLGGSVAASLDGEDRINAEDRLNALCAALDDLDVAGLNAGADERSAPGFSKLSLLLDAANARFTELRVGLPPTPVAEEDL